MQKDLSELEELTEEHLGFSPLSDGLGFELKAKEKPFTDSLQMGAGAVAAGPAMPVLTRSAKATPGSIPNLRPAALAMQEPGAPLSLRTAAFFSDLFFLSAPITLALLWNFSVEELRVLFVDNRKSFAIFYLIFFMSYFLLSESFGGQSPGKMLFNLRIVEDDKYQKPIGLNTAFARLVSLLPATGFLGIGLWTAFWDSKSRPFHDKVTGSIVRSKK